MLFQIKRTSIIYSSGWILLSYFLLITFRFIIFHSFNYNYCTQLVFFLGKEIFLRIFMLTQKHTVITFPKNVPLKNKKEERTRRKEKRKKERRKRKGFLISWSNTNFNKEIFQSV